MYAIVSGFMGLIIGLSYGRSLESDSWQRLLLESQLPPACESRLDSARDRLNDIADDLARGQR